MLLGEIPRVSSYWVEKSRCPVTLYMRDGRTLSGEIFLNPISRHRVAPEQPAEFLNQPDPFFILAPTYDERLLIAKEAVARTGELDLLGLGIAVALMIGALTLFLIVTAWTHRAPGEKSDAE